MNILTRVCASLMSPHLETPNDAYHALQVIASPLSEDMTVAHALEVIEYGSFIRLAQGIFAVNRALDYPGNAECFEQCRLRVKQELSKLL